MENEAMTKEMTVEQIMKLSQEWRNEFAASIALHVENKDFKKYEVYVGTLNNFKGKLTEFLRKKYTQYLIDTKQLSEKKYADHAFLAEVADKAIENFTKCFVNSYEEEEFRLRQIMNAKNARIDAEVADANSGTIIYNPNDVADLIALDKANSVARKNELLRLRTHDANKAEYENSLYTFFMKLARAQMPNYIELFVNMLTTIHHFILDAIAPPEYKELGLPTESAKNIIANVADIAEAELKIQALDSIYEENKLCVKIARAYPLSNQEIFDKLASTNMLSWALLERFENILKNCENNYVYDTGRYKSPFAVSFYDMFIVAEKLGLADVKTIMNLFIYKYNNTYCESYTMKKSSLLKYCGVHNLSREATAEEKSMISTLKLTSKAVYAYPFACKDYCVDVDARFYFANHPDYDEVRARCKKILDNLSPEARQNAKKQAEEVQKAEKHYNVLKNIRDEKAKKGEPLWGLSILAFALAFILILVNLFSGDIDVFDEVYGVISCICSAVLPLVLLVFTWIAVVKRDSYAQTVRYGIGIAIGAFLSLPSHFFGILGIDGSFFEDVWLALIIALLSGVLSLIGSILAIVGNVKASKMEDEIIQAAKEYGDAKSRAQMSLK